MMSLMRCSYPGPRSRCLLLTLTRRTLFANRTPPLMAQQDAALPYHLVVGLPALSPTMDAGALAEWYLREGDSFAAGDGIAKIETDKAAMDFEAQDDGFVAKILVQAGQGNDIPIGTPIMITVENAADVAAFKDYTSPVVVAAAVAAAPPPVVVAAPPPPPPAPVAATAAPAAPPPFAAAAAVVVAPVVAIVAAAAAPTGTAAFSAAWGLSVVHTSPLARTLAAEQNDYLSKYGTTGQAPIL